MIEITTSNFLTTAQYMSSSETGDYLKTVKGAANLSSNGQYIISETTGKRLWSDSFNTSAPNSGASTLSSSETGDYLKTVKGAPSLSSQNSTVLGLEANVQSSISETTGKRFMSDSFNTSAPNSGVFASTLENSIFSNSAVTANLLSGVWLFSTSRKISVHGPAAVEATSSQVNLFTNVFLIKFSIKLPYTILDFNFSLQIMFRNAIANAAGVEPQEVQIDAHNARRSSDQIIVDVTIECLGTYKAHNISNRLTAANVNYCLVQAGLQSGSFVSDIYVLNSTIFNLTQQFSQNETSSSATNLLSNKSNTLLYLIVLPFLISTAVLFYISRRRRRATQTTVLCPDQSKVTITSEFQLEDQVFQIPTPIAGHRLESILMPGFLEPMPDFVSQNILFSHVLEEANDDAGSIRLGRI